MGKIVRASRPGRQEPGCLKSNNDSGPALDLAWIAQLGGVKWLDIHAPLADDALGPLAGLRKLRRLDLPGAAIGDAGLARLRGLRDLRALNLAGTQVTDSSIDLLAGMRSLRSVDLTRTQITEAGVRRLRALRTDLAVVY